MLRMLVVFFVWEVSGLLCFGSDLECCCLLSVHQRHADPVDNFTVHFVTIKCLGNVVLKARQPVHGSALGSRAESGWAVTQFFSFI